jgi:Family of unknown function (DUF5995)
LSQSDSTVVDRMQELITRWEALADRRATFLTCYMMMTRNMLAAIDRQEFEDPTWVAALLRRFADYYFVALEEYEQDHAKAPMVWKIAHDATCDRRVMAVQELLLGVNAHINYDLVFALVDLLGPEWDALSEDRRAARYADHSRVNDVIGRTIDDVQGQVLERDSRFLALIDNLLGPVDELLTSRLIAHWRDTVWHNAVRLLEAREAGERDRLIEEIEQDAIRLGNLIA